MNHDGWRGVGVVGALSLSVCSLITVFSSPPQYSRTLYRAYPPVFWICFGATIVAGVALIVHAGRNGNGRWMHGGGLIGGVYFLFTALPMDMGLPFWTVPLADPFVHFSFVDTILDTGVVPIGDPYPPLHIYVAQSALVTGLPPETFQLFGALSTVLFLAGCALYARQLFAGRRVAVFTLAAAVPLMYTRFAVSAIPWFASFALIPLALLLIDRYSKRLKNGASLPIGLAGSALAMVVGISFYHPMTGLVLLGTLFTATGTVFVCNRLFRGYDWPGYRPEWIVVGTCSLGAYYASNAAFQAKVTDVIASLVTAETGTAGQAGQASESGYTVYQLLVRFLILEYGAALVYIAVGGVLFVYVLYRLRGTRAERGETVLAGFFLSGLCVGVSLLAINLGAAGPYRINQLTIFATVMLIGWALVTFSSGDRTSFIEHTSVVQLVVVGAVVVAAVLVPLSVYPGSEYQTAETFDGAQWFIGHRNASIATREHGLTGKTTRYLLGERRYDALRDRPFGGLSDNDLPRHLGYVQNASVARTFDQQPTYLITTVQSAQWWKTEPANRYPHIDYYTEKDVSQLRRDDNADRVYANGQFAVWMAN